MWITRSELRNDIDVIRSPAHGGARLGIRASGSPTSGPRASGSAFANKQRGRGGAAAPPRPRTPESLQPFGYSPLPVGETRIFTAVSLRLMSVSKPSSTSPSRPIRPVMKGLRSIFPDSTSAIVAGWEFT